jgi:hypothetical protein
MALVMIACPATGRQAFTGVETHPADVALIPAINVLLLCPECGGKHLWSMLDAEFVTWDDRPCQDLPGAWRSLLARLDREGAS